MRCAWVLLVGVVGCSRSDPGDGYPSLPAAVITALEVVDDPAYAGQVGVRVVVHVENHGEAPFAVVDASLAADADLVTFEAFRADFSEVAPGGVARLRFFGRVATLDALVSVPLDPLVLVTTELSPGVHRAEITATPAWLSVEPLGPALVVSSAVDDLDGPLGMTALDEAGATLSLREAIVLANNGHPLSRIAFDPAVFPPGAPANIVLGGGNAGLTALPAIVRGGLFLDGTGAGVRVTRAPGLAAVANAVRIDAAGVTVRAIELQAILYVTGPDVTLERTTHSAGQGVVATSAHRLAVRNCDLVDGAAGSVTNSQDVTVSASRLNGHWDFNNAPGPVWERNAMSGGFLTIRASPFAQVRDASFTLPPGGQTQLSLTDAPSSTIERCNFMGIGLSLPALSLVASPNTRVLEIDATGFDHAAVASDAATVGAIASPIVVELRDGVASGTARDGDLINLYEIDVRSRVFSGMSVATNGGWSIDTGDSSLVRVVATASPPGSGTSADSAIFVTPLPSCTGGRLLGRTSFEPGEVAAVNFSNVTPVLDFAAPDGNWTLVSSATPPFTVTEALTVDVSGAAAPYARLFTSRPYVGLELLPTLVFEDGGVPVHTADVPFESSWGRRTVDLAPLAGYLAPLHIRVDLPSSTYIDALEICDGPH